MNKTFRKAVKNGPQLKNKANNTRNAIDISNYKNQNKKTKNM